MQIQRLNLKITISQSLYGLLFVENSTIFTDCAIQAYIDRNSSKWHITHKVYIYA